MANKETKTKVELTSENITDETKAGMILRPELKEKMDQELKDEKDKVIIRETKARYTRANWNINMGLIAEKKMKGLLEASKYNMRQLGRLQRLLTGFEVTEKIVTEYAKTTDDVLGIEKLDEKKKVLIIKVPKADKKGREEKEFKVGDIVPATIDFSEFDNGLAKLKENLRERVRNVEKTYEEDSVVQKKAAGEYWCSEWMYNFNVVTGSGLSNDRY